ncbi:Protein of unknown function, partial [Gryllus bimaculatus]
VARVLLAAGAGAGLRDWTGCTALHLAAAGGHASAARGLMGGRRAPLRRDHRAARRSMLPAPPHALRALLATAAPTPKHAPNSPLATHNASWKRWPPSAGERTKRPPRSNTARLLQQRIIAENDELQLGPQ